MTIKKRVLVFIVSYNAEAFIVDVFNRIPESLWTNQDFDLECLVIDDQSTDNTYSQVSNIAGLWPDRNITVLQNPKNQGYGGNQKIGYHYAIENKFDAVLLLHGDGQYPPEMIEAMVSPLLSGDADAVFGSRMIHKQQALKGGMPFYKWIANQFLTNVQNRILGSNLSEFHSGFRAYSVLALASIPFAQNSNYFDFDTDIIIQLLDTGHVIKEIPIPTRYGKEISRVNGIIYGLLILKTTVLSRLVPFGIFYNSKFDYHTDNSYYTLKLGFRSSHQFAIDRVKENSVVLDLGCGPGLMAHEFSKKRVKTISIDRYILPETRQYSYKAIESEIESFDFETEQMQVDYVLLLDIIEHLKSPEALFFKLRERYGGDQPEFVITTANVAFILVRLSLLAGQFNYAKRGILDLDHSRLFTFQSLRKMLRASGYEIINEEGIPGPFPLALGDTKLAWFLTSVNQILIWFSKSIFAYQMAFIVKPKPSLTHLLASARKVKER